ncbi:MAG: DNA-binding protein [Magnetococcales bacterium]|nr:DNA-binding protein [Magnetococcales bacterium]MBF0583604.1 DNA-binding protein [Magnetococcales bacterium]
MDAKFVRTQVAAQFIGVSKSLLEKLRITGGGPRFALLGSAVVYAIPDLESWVASRTVASTSEGGGLPNISTDARSRKLKNQLPTTTSRRGRPRKAATANPAQG